MKYKHLIIPLAILLGVLLIIKNYQDVNVYPRRIRHSRVSNNHESLGSIVKITSAINDKDNNKCDNTLFFCKKGTKLGLSKESFDKLSNNDTTITLKGKKVKCDVMYLFNEKSNCLDGVLVKILGKDLSDYKKLLIDYYGIQHINIYGGYTDEYIWYFPDSYVFVECSKHYDYSDDMILITVSTYTRRDYLKLPSLVYLGGCYSSDFKKEKQTFKYGDSDVYQGSSQQKADLQAIDDYFGF